MIFELPREIADLVAARNRLKAAYNAAGLTFTFDGNLVGDIGEAVAQKLFGIALLSKNSAGVDGKITLNGIEKTVQIKATGVKGGAAFRKTETKADYLLFFSFDFEKCSGELIYNGPESNVRNHLSANEKTGKRRNEWTDGSQKAVAFGILKSENAKIQEHDKIPILV